jgi:hypothetical protein
MNPIIKKIWTSDPTELTDRLKRIKPVYLGSANSFVFKINKEILSDIESDNRIRVEIIKRAQGKPVYLIRYGQKKSIFLVYQIKTDGVKIITNKDLIQSIQEYDLNEVINQTNGECIFDAPENIHFITPSGKHTTRFLRLSDALYSYNALDRLSFWLQPYIAKSSVVVIDTWSLSSIVLKTQQLLNIDIPFDCFNEHIIANDVLALKILNKLTRRLTSDKPILFIIGISSSGAFSKMLPALLKESNIENSFNILSLYTFKNAPENVDTLAHLNIEVEWYEEEDCPLCESNGRNTTYQIDSKYYFPRKFEEKAVRFSKTLLENDDKKQSNASKFIHKYGGHKGVLAVHKDDPNDGTSPRHHAFYVDVSALMEVDDFLRDLDLKIAEIEQYHGIPDTVVTPPHDAANKIVKYLRQKWKSTNFLSDHDLRGITEIERKWVINSKHICFVDDVTITGNRISEYLRALRENFIGELSDLVITWFPLIVRSSSLKGLEKTKDSLSNHKNWDNKLIYACEIILPDWFGESECPWCQESSIYERIIQAPWDIPKWFENRRLLLNNTSIGLLEKPMLIYPFCSSPTLGAKSPLGKQGINEMQVLFLLSTGIQLLRYHSTLPLGRDDLLQRYVLFFEGQEDEKNNTFERFSEPLIQCGLLRVVKINEWSRTLKKTGVDFFTSKLAKGASDVLIGEALLFLIKSGYKKRLPVAFENRILGTVDDVVTTSLKEYFENYEKT